MAFTHGKNTFVSLNAVDLSAFTNSTEWKQAADSHDTTTYGKNSHTFAGGLLNGTATIKGVYDNGTTGPHDVIQPLIGTVVTFIHRPEGTGVGRPQNSVSVLVTAYEESSPVADMCMWTAELQLSDTITSTNQP